MHFGRLVTADESRVAGWYKSAMTIGPEPKPIRTGATIHSLCVTHGPLRAYKHFVRVYGGKSDGDLETKHQNTATLQKWVNLYNIMLHSFKGAGRCVTMDSAYMGDIMALIGRHEWKTNMIGTAQENRNMNNAHMILDGEGRNELMQRVSLLSDVPQLKQVQSYLH